MTTNEAFATDNTATHVSPCQQSATRANAGQLRLWQWAPQGRLVQRPASVIVSSTVDVPKTRSSYVYNPCFFPKAEYNPSSAWVDVHNFFIAKFDGSVITNHGLHKLDTLSTTNFFIAKAA
jgi:hypothetical protein